MQISVYKFQVYGDARGVTVMVVMIGLGHPSSIPDWVCVSLCANPFGKRVNPSILSYAMAK